MKLIVDRVSKTGLGIASNGTWYNRGKGCNVASFVGLEGSEVEVTLQDNRWVMNLVKLAPGIAPNLSLTEPVPSSNGHIKSQNQFDAGAMARAVAVKSVLSSSLLIDSQLKTQDLSEVWSNIKAQILEVANYVQNGTFIDKLDQNEKK